MNDFFLEFTVRDYEVDLQGIVNNAVYLHYLEHARHVYLASKNIDFAMLHKEGKDLIVSRIEIDYKHPLKSRDKFKVTLRIIKEGNLRVIFEQSVLRLPDEKLIVKAKVTGVCLRNGKPVRPEEIIDMSLFGIG
jgi:acyl-CoA thioester hydrolase